MNAADWFRKGLKVKVQMQAQRLRRDHPRLHRALRAAMDRLTRPDPVSEPGPPRDPPAG